AEVLGTTEPSVTVGFFDFGGGSIRAIDLAGVSRAAGVPLRVRDLFECLSIVAIATVLAERDGWIGVVPTAGGVQPGEAIVVEATDDAGSPTRLTITPADCADHNLPAHIDRIRLDGSQPPAARSGALIGPQHDLGEVADALVAASDAYGTDLTELVVAAVLSHLAARSAGVAAGILVADIAESGCAAQPALVRLDPVPADPAQLIRAARDAVRAKRRTAAFQPAAGDLAAPVLRVVALPTGVRLTAAEAPEAGMQIVVTPVQLAVAGADREAAAVLASDLRDRLAALVEHCTDIGSSYAAADFPDAGLDDAALARLLSRVQRTEEE
ncbi:MAG: phosphopantetheine-binding protein, partial [Mycobacteriales bacterium]